MFLLETLGEFHELKSNMLENEEYIISNIKEDNPKKKNYKIRRWFMINEVSTDPLHPSDFLPEWQRNIEDEPKQKDSRDSLTKSAQSTPSGKRKQRDNAQKDQAHKLTKSEKQKIDGHRMRFLVGKDNGKTNATITASKEEIDYQFQYPGKNKVIKEYKNSKDFYSWSDEEESVKVDTEPIKSHISPKIYDLHTPLKKYKGKDKTEIILLTDSSPDLSKKTEKK